MAEHHRLQRTSRFLPTWTLALSLAAAVSLAAQGRNVSGGPLHERQACFDVQHYNLRLTVDPDERSIRGSLEMRAKAIAATDSIFLDLDGLLSVETVTVAGKPAEALHTNGRLEIALPRQVTNGDAFEVEIAYGGKPRVAPKPPWSGGFTWAKTRAGKPWIATSCQGEGADLWWPCKDHPSDKPESMDLWITVPKDLYCASNGKLVGIEKRGRNRTFHWRISVPISNYCVALNIAPYKIIERQYESVTGEKVPAFFFALPENEKRARKAFPHFLDHVRHMEEVCGPYPFRSEKYAVAETPHLGMEHQTIIAYGNNYKLGRDGYDWLHHHEMSHEWWANLVTCRDWSDMWIHEGLGTYMQALYMEHKHGRKGYLREMRTKRFISNRAAVAPRKVLNTQQIHFSGGAGLDVYNKGSWIVHTMRWLMGDEKFFVVLRRFAYPDPEMEKVTDGSCVRLTDTEEIRAIAEKHYGKDLSWFFEVYLRQPKLPRVVVVREGRKVKLSWDVPIDVPFPMPIPVQVDGEIRRVEMPEGKAEIEVPEGAKVNIDPERWVLQARARRSGR